MAKKKPAPKKREEAITLTVPDRFFIESHGEISQEDLAEILGKPVEIIRQYVLELASKYEKGKKTRTRTLMDRPSKGVTAMNQAASMSGDDGYGKAVTLESINRAMMENNFELAKELKARYAEAESKNKNVIRQKYSPFIHYIEKPDDDAEVY